MKLWLKIILILFVIGIAAGVLVYVFVVNKPKPDYEKAKPEYIVDAKALYLEYSSNKDGIGIKYTNKVVQVNGSVSKTEVNDTMVVVVIVFNQGMFGDEGVRFTMLPDFRNKAKNLKPGDPIKIKGICRGFDADVKFEQCSFVE